jgi:hypothetical protein
MIRREEILSEDRDRIEAFNALAHPAATGLDRAPIDDSPPPVIEIHDGEVFDESSPEEDILEGLDRIGLDPRRAKSRSPLNDGAEA